ncbi:hypothetical protein L2E82_26722 [Cichorium intybus]|uniref:Uncharacterized protein n=1 Tax=Cichorium intybus TaxID=13427 RepID=A0ACB9CRP2_CICIN|nr:hypothetical protein L2E82_26722 [Cichorium intybus]
MSIQNNTSMNKLEGKVAIITGGASGIGEVTACLFAKHGARAVVIADVQDELGKKLSESIGANCSTYIHCDVSNEAQVKSLTVVDLDVDQFDRLFAINVRGMALCVKHSARSMIEKKLGPHGIRVNAVSPFAVATPLMCNVHGKDATEIEKIYEQMASLKDVVLKAEDIAEAVLFLACSKESRYITGLDMAVDGGFDV